MLGTATSLAVITTGGAYLIYDKLPAKIKKFIVKHSLLSDVLAFIAVYMILGGTLTALIAAAMMGVMVSLMLHIANNKKDYLYLYDLRDMIKDKLSAAQKALSEYGDMYRQRKLNEAGNSGT
jgi:O-antigen/teichoic acid export membrane protein